MNKQENYEILRKPKLVLFIQIVLAMYALYYFSDLFAETKLVLSGGILNHPMVLGISIPIILMCIMSIFSWEFKWKWSKTITVVALVLVFLAYVYVNYLRSFDMYLPGPVMNNRSEMVGAVVVEVVRHAINLLLILLLLFSKRSKQFILSHQN